MTHLWLNKIAQLEGAAGGARGGKMLREIPEVLVASFRNLGGGGSIGDVF